MDFACVQLLSLIPNLRLSICLVCKEPHRNLHCIKDTLDQLPFPSNSEAITSFLEVVASNLLCFRHKAANERFVRKWVRGLNAKRVLSKPPNCLPNAFPATTLDLRSYLQRKSHIVSVRKGRCHGCTKCFQQGAQVHSAICGRSLCSSCNTSHPYLICLDSGVCDECGGTLWSWTFGETDQYALFNVWKPRIRLQIQYNGQIVLDEGYPSTQPLWPLLGLFCDFYRLDQRSATLRRLDDSEVDRFASLDEVSILQPGTSPAIFVIDRLTS
jgi:hypothetical protein